MRVEQVSDLNLKVSYWRGVAIEVEDFGYISTNIQDVVDETIDFITKGKPVTIQQKCRAYASEKPRIALKKVWNKRERIDEVRLNLLDTCVVDCQDLFKPLVIGLINKGYPVVVDQFTKSPPQEDFMADHLKEYPDELERSDEWKDDECTELSPDMLIDDAVLESIKLQTGAEARIEDRKFKGGLFRRAKYRPNIVFQI